MSSKKKRKRSCPFSNAKKTPKRKTSKAFSKEWAEALAASDKRSYFEQDKLLELDGPVNNEEDDAVPVVSASRLKLKGKCEEDPLETEAEESESEESESQNMHSQGSWQKLNYRTIVSGPSLQENLRKSVSCRFCHRANSPRYFRFPPSLFCDLLDFAFGIVKVLHPVLSKTRSE